MCLCVCLFVFVRLHGTAIERQAAAGVCEADVIILTVDGQVGLHSGDAEILSWLRSSFPHKEVILAVNKCEASAKAEMMVSELKN